jgi:hypothetical protein
MATKDISSGLDLAYGCFSLIAFVIIAVTIVQLLPLDFTTMQSLGMLAGLPLVMAAIAAGVVGTVLSFMRWREWPLLIMAALSASMVVVFLAEDEWKLVSGRVETAWSVAAAGALVLFCVRWFAFVRRRAKAVDSKARI